MTTHHSRSMPPHGRAAWDGTAGLGARGDVTSVVTGERHPITVGAVVATRPFNDGGKGGMVIDIEVNDDGERVLTIVTHNENLDRPFAWTLRLSESEIDPGLTLPDSMAKRHGYAKFLYRVCSDGRYVSESDLRLAGIAANLVAQCVKG